MSLVGLLVAVIVLVVVVWALSLAPLEPRLIRIVACHG